MKFLVSSESTKFGTRARVARQADFKGSSENVEHSDQSARRLEVNGITMKTIQTDLFTDFKTQQAWPAKNFQFWSIRVCGYEKLD